MTKRLAVPEYSNRLAALDVFRGMTMALMILVNMAGVADNCYWPLDHAPWNGWTPTDMVFPFFLFAVGMSLPFSFSRYLESDQAPGELYAKILKRAALLFGIGVLINGFNGFHPYDFAHIRIMGVLQRIALAYLGASALILFVRNKMARLLLAAAILIGYWAAMMWLPVPEHGAGVLTREGNFGSYIDRLLIPAAHLYGGDGWKHLGDPEGLFSTLTAVVSTLIGFFAGDWLRGQTVSGRTAKTLFLAGLVLAALGWLWAFEFPINKKIWTSSYALFMGGLATVLLSACYQTIEVLRRVEWAAPFKVLGMNSLAAFIGSVMMIKILVKTHIGQQSAYDWINGRLFESWAGPFNGPTIFAALTVVLWWGLCSALYRRQSFIKV